MKSFIPDARRRLDSLVSRRRTLSAKISDEKAELRVCKEGVEHSEQAQSILQRLAQEVQQQAHKQVARIVSRCLSAVFETPYELRIEFTRKRGRTEAEFSYLRSGQLVRPNVDSGGVMEVAALALRMTSLVLSHPARRRLLVLDEPFRGVSERNLPKMARLIECLNEELGVQFLIVTHSQQLQVGEVINLDRRVSS